MTLKHKETERQQINKTLIEQCDYERLYKDNYYLLLRMIKKYNYRANGVEMEEAISLANIAFMKAVKSYDSQKSQFSTYLALQIRDIFYKQYRHEHVQKRNTQNINLISLDALFYSENDKQDLASMIAVDPFQLDEFIENKFLLQSCTAYLSQMPKGELYVQLLQWRLLGYTQSEIANQLGISQAHTSRILTKVKKLLKAHKELSFNRTSHRTQEEKTVMAKIAPKLEGVITLIQEGITEADLIAEKLKISLQTAKAYRFAALRELEKRQAALIQPTEESPAKEDKSLGESLEKENLEKESLEKESLEEVLPAAAAQITEEIKETPVLTTIEQNKENDLKDSVKTSVKEAGARRLKPIVIASCYFSFEIKKNTVWIQPVNTKEVLIIAKSELDNFIEDLKQINHYL